MSFSEEYKQRAIELKKLYGYKTTYTEIAKDFPNVIQPNPKTIWRWEKAAVEQSNIKGNDQKIDTINIGRKNDHFDDLVEIAKEMLRGMGLVQKIGNKYRCYGIEGEKGKSPAMLSKKDLAKGFNSKMIAVYKKKPILSTGLIAHIEAENPEYNSAMKFLEEKPDKFITYLQLLVKRNRFKGICDICKDWR